MSCYRR